MDKKEKSKTILKLPNVLFYICAGCLGMSLMIMLIDVNKGLIMVAITVGIYLMMLATCAINDSGVAVTHEIYTCPNCHGTNCTKIGSINRLASVSVMGLASSKIGKTMECHDCGYKW